MFFVSIFYVVAVDRVERQGKSPMCLPFAGNGTLFASLEVSHIDVAGATRYENH